MAFALCKPMPADLNLATYMPVFSGCPAKVLSAQRFSWACGFERFVWVLTNCEIQKHQTCALHMRLRVSLDDISRQKFRNRQGRPSVRTSDRRRAGSSNMPSLGTQTDTPMAVGGVYVGSPRCPAPVTEDWRLKQRPSWRIGGTRRSGMRPRPRCPEQIHRSSTTDGGVITAEVWNWITES